MQNDLMDKAILFTHTQPIRVIYLHIFHINP